MFAYAKSSRLIISFLLFALFAVSTSVNAQKLASGAKLNKLTGDGKSIAISYAPRGDKILYKRRHTSTQRQLFIADSNGKNEEAITPTGHPYYAQWSWRGNKIAYLFSNTDNSESQAYAYIYDLNTKKTKTITAAYLRKNLEQDEGPIWSPDDRYLVFTTRRGPNRNRYVTVYDNVEDATWDVLPERGENRLGRWSWSGPLRLAMLSSSSEGYYDIIVCDPHGRDMVMLTNNGAESIKNWDPQWRPPNDYPAQIFYISDLEMTKSEREMSREDIWCATPDGSDIRNLTVASSPASEYQFNTDYRLWSWDGCHILGRGDRFDQQGKDIHTLYMMDPDRGGYEILFTTTPKEDGIYEREQVTKCSWDNRYVMLYTQRYDVKNWATDREYQRTRHIISMLDIQTKEREEILFVDEQIERLKVLGHNSRGTTDDITFSPDGKSLLLSIASIVSEEENINQPDVYTIQLPSKYWSQELAANPGPPIGRDPTLVVPSSGEAALEQDTASSEDAVLIEDDSTGYVTKAVLPEFMTVEETLESLSSKYSQYCTVNKTRNLILFKGPKEMLAELEGDLKLIDTKPPQILVDLLAVELSDEANRELGLDWTYAEGRFGFFQPAGKAIRDLTPDPLLSGLTTYPGSGQMFYQGVGTLPSEFFVRLTALVKDGQGTILANPRTVATSGHESMIKIRRVVNFFFTEGYDTSGRPIVKKSDISADTIGQITPTLLPNNTIHLNVDIGVGSFTFTEVSGLPEQTQRQSTTEVIVSQGETIVIGGLRQQEMSTATHKVPLLGDIPLLGALFRSEKTEVKNSVLTIFITPQLMVDGEPAPEWEQLDPEELQIIPIMKDGTPNILSNKKHIKVKK